MLALQLILTLILLAIGSFAPGFFLVRRLRWSPLEKLCGSIGLSLILLYLAAWGIYVAGPADQRPAFFAVSMVCCLLGALAWRDAVALLRVARVRRAALGYAFLLLWTLLVTAIVRVYSGANWSADWFEHFERTLFFLHRFPADTPLFAGYKLPARPPMMNVLAAFFLGQTQDRFETFQVIFVFLNSLPFLACCLAMPRLVGPRRQRLLPLVAFFAMNPVVMENATYSWTKLLAAFYVILALWFYLAAWKKNDIWRMTAAFLALSAGLLVHYSAGPYCLFLGLHYLIVVFRKRPRPWRELAVFGCLCGLLLAPWFGWSVAKYGLRVTAASNTSVTSSQQYQGSNLGKIAGNLFDSIVPAALRDASLFSAYDQPNSAGKLRDQAFMTYQPNLILGMGLVGGPLVVCLAIFYLRRRAGPGLERSFWRIMVPAIIVLGIAVVGERDPFGVAHLTLLPLEMLGLTLLAAAWSGRRVLAFAVLAGCLADFSLGVLLQARVENLENSAARTVFADPVLAPGSQATAQEPALSRMTWGNWYIKHQYALCREWLDRLDQYHPADAQSRQQVEPVRLEFRNRLDQLDVQTRGWFPRNGGSMTYLGDHFGAGELPTALLLALWMGLLWKLYREARQIAPRSVPLARVAKRPRKKAAARR